jgi:CheY-like chemotaxis protein
MADEISRILIVDDNRFQRKLEYKVILDKEPAGYEFECLQAENAEIALEICNTQKIHCVVVDYYLPGKDGVEFIEALHKTVNNPPPCIMVTGMGDENVAIRALRAGAVDYLIKDHKAQYLSALPRLIKKSIDRYHQKAWQDLLEGELNAVLALSRDPMFAVDANGKVVFANSALARCLQIDPNDLIGAPLEQFWASARSFDEQALKNYFLEKGDSTGPDYPFEAQIVIGTDATPQSVKFACQNLSFNDPNHPRLAVIAFATNTDQPSNT